MKWINIKDKKPTEEGMYVYRRKEGSMSGWKEIHPVIGFVKDGKMIGTMAFDWIRVTHWLKLPPNREQQKEAETSENAALNISDVVQSNCFQLDVELFTALRKWEQACIDFGMDKDTIETKLIYTIDEATTDIDLCR